MQAYIYRLKNAAPNAEMRSEASSSSSSITSDQDGLNKAQDGAIVYLPPVAPSKKKKQSPQAAIDEFWGKFNSKTPGRASTILPRDKYSKKVGEKIPQGVVPGENAVASYEEAAKICKEKVEKIVKECRRVNQKYRDPHFDIEFDLKWGVNNCLTMLADTADVETGFGPGSVKRVEDIFEKPEFFKSGATANDIRQGRDGDCWFMSALCTLGNKSGLIEKVCVARDEKVGVYGFVFYRDGEWISEVIDDKLYLTKPDYDESWVERNMIEDARRINSEEDYRKIYQTGSGALYFAQCEDPNETWLPLLEKAYAKAHGDYAAIEGGFTGEGLEDLTGGVTTEIFSSDILDKDYFWNEELLKVNKDFLFGCAAGIFWGPWGERKGIIEGHAYSILKAVEIDGKRLCLLRNPWGTYEWNGPWSDGSKEWTPEWMQKLDHRFGDDGAFWMSYEDLLKKYQTFDRTRLFDEDWKVTQQWTTLTVPWTADYHTTKFSFTIEEATSVVLVLSQLDSRYFRGLEGQYRFQLCFRVHKAGDDDYIVRSHGNYWMSRSVTAELNELEPGDYDVLVKITAEKMTGALPVEDVVRNNAKDRSDKLQRIGLTFDLAHAKGQIKETDEEKKLRKKLDALKKAKAQKEMKDKLTKEKQKRKHNENKELRKQRAAAEKRKAKAKAKAAKKAEKEKADKEEREKKEREDKAAKGDLKEVATATSEKPAETVANSPAEAVVATAPTGESKPTEPAPVKEADETPATSDSKPADSMPTDKPAETKKEELQSATDKDKPAEANKEEALTPAPAPEILLNGSAPPSLAGFSDIEDDDDLSEIESVISDISAGVVEDAIAEAKLAAENAPPPPTNDDEEDEYEKDPWNAIAVVGLRVYCKGGKVGVRVVRPRLTEEEVLGKKKEGSETPSEVGLGDSKLDVDDSAKDATKGVESAIEKAEEAVGKKEALEKKDVDGSQKGEHESEGSIVMV